MNNKNIIKRKTHTLKIFTLIDLNNGALPKNSIIVVAKELGAGWFGGGYRWFLDVLRDANIVKILEQV